MNRFCILAAALMMASCSKNSPETGRKPDKLQFSTTVSPTGNQIFSGIKEGTPFNLYFLQGNSRTESAAVVGHSSLDAATLSLQKDKPVTLFSVIPSTNQFTFVNGRVEFPESLSDKDVMLLYKKDVLLQNLSGSELSFSHIMHVIRIKITDNSSSRAESSFSVMLQARKRAYLDLQTGEFKADDSSTVSSLPEKNGTDMWWYVAPQNIDGMELTISRGGERRGMALRSLMEDKSVSFMNKGMVTLITYDWETKMFEIAVQINPWEAQGEVSSEVNY